MPRSEATTSTATRFVSVRSDVSGCRVVECVATAETACVIAWAYGPASADRARARPILDAAMSSCARNIFFRDCVDLIRCL
ncbi:hypothetical protein D3C74_399360 [compost metagenome]